jgi:putative ABC transport system permease protein
MIDVTFFRADRQDATINFISERPLSALTNVGALPGIMRMEPFRTVPVRIRHGHIERRIAITGRPSTAELSRVLGEDFQPIHLPESGIAISDMLARILNVSVGDLVEIELLERDRRRVQLPVTAIIQGYLGLAAHMELSAANRVLREGSLISGAFVSVDTNRSGELFDALKRTPVANFIALQRVSLQKFRETLAQNLLWMVTVYVTLAAIIAFGVVYNFARISLSEQGRELASLRVLGFTSGEVFNILLLELAILTILAQPLGWVIGYGFAYATVVGFESELYRVPLIVGRDAYAIASLVVFAAAAVSALVVRRRVNRLNLIEVLKTRE